ncbi:MAG: OmpA family protein [Phycisphaerae bacterium]
MTRQTISGLLLVAAGFATLTGCGEDPKQRIALLESENQRLLDDLARAQQEADQARRDASLCDQELAGLRSDRATLAARVNELETAKPEVPTGWTAVPGGAMIAIPGEVLFRSGKADLRKEAHGVLNELTQAVSSQYAASDVLVYGHTDNDPIKKSGWKDNYELSAQRALSVVRFLQGKGIDPTRLVACGCGEHRPVAPNTSSANRSRNRRVEIFALEATTRSPGR